MRTMYGQRGSSDSGPLARLDKFQFMILKRLMQNPFDQAPKPWKPWYGYLFGIVFLVSVGLYGWGRIHGAPVIPTSTVPALSYQEVLKKHVEETKVVEEPVVSEPVVPVVAPVPDSPLNPPINGGTPETDPVIQEVAQKMIAELPKKTSGNLAVPFTSQAPFGNWDVVHEDTCEEASVLMVKKYFDSETANIDPTVADTALLAMVDFEDKNNFFKSLTAAELGTFTEAYYPTLKATIVENPTIEQLKGFVDAGTPVIVPAAGQQLGNPFYSGIGPLFHYVVIRGYDETNFITNDPGTRHGENYSYSQSVVMSAMHDWNGGDPVNGAKRVLILSVKK